MRVTIPGTGKITPRVYYVIEQIKEDSNGISRTEQKRIEDLN